MICAIIPTLNSSGSLDRLHQQLRPHVGRLIVSDGGSVDTTLNIAVQRGGLAACGSPGRGTQLRRGASWSSHCDWLLFIHADSKLEETWHVAMNDFISQRSDNGALAGYFALRFDSPKWQARVVERLASLRCRILSLPYGDQGLLISRKLYDEIGGFSDMPLFEDVAIAKTLGKHRLKPIGAVLFTSADKYERDGYFKRGWHNLRLLRRYLKGESPESLSKAYT